jgi:hypothetical protein
MNGIKFKSAVKAAFVAAAMFAAPAAAAFASAPSADAAAGCNQYGPVGCVEVGGSQWAPASVAAAHDLNVYNNGSDLRAVYGSDSWGPEWQCTEFATRWADAAWGDGGYKAWDAAGWNGSAQNMYDVAPRLRVPLTQIPNGDPRAPQFGDLLIFGEKSGPGHVAVVLSVDRSTGKLTFIGQNQYAAPAIVSIPISRGNAVSTAGFDSSLWVRGWLRGGTPSSTSSTPSPILDNHGNPVIYFRGTNNLLQQTHWVTGQGWVTDSPSDLPSGVAMAGNPSAVVAQGNPVIYFRGTNNLLQQTHWATGQGWVTDSPSGVAMAGDPSAVLDNQGNPVIYFRGTNNLLQQTHWATGQGWVTDSPSGVAMAGNPSAVDAQGNPVIYFRGTNNLLQQTHWATGQGWVTDSPSDLPSGVSF